MQSLPNAPRRQAETTTVGILTLRQLECLYWAQEGKSATDIGQLVGISGRTVERHLFNACRTLGVRTRIQAAIKARDLQLLPTASGSAERLAAPRSFRR
ncbi:response regulator transcription factor [Phenylobacterium sp.]|uniref:response regulator transcription factor n=1 Tax=Phenylobacterium sp. TaxID=1871053 RepID=UPI003567472C